MNLEEAYKVLGLAPGMPPDEVKKKARQLMKQYHPDINKEPGAEDKFKEINKAVQTIENPPQQFAGSHPGHGGFNIEDFLNGNMRGRPRKQPVHVQLKTTISFKDSIFGCSKEFTYDFASKCGGCNGQGMYSLHNGCNECGGQGVVIKKHGNMIMQQTCGKCHGRINTENCKACSGTGGVKSNRTITVTIPGGIKDNNVLRLEGMGNFVEVVNNLFGSGEAFTDAFVQVSVQKPEFDCIVNQNNLHVKLNISLLEALSGCTKTVETLEGSKEIKIPEKTKNAQQVIIPNLGVSRTGNQIVDINVDYPQDIDSLIGYLSK